MKIVVQKKTRYIYWKEDIIAGVSYRNAYLFHIDKTKKKKIIIIITIMTFQKTKVNFIRLLKTIFSV